MKKYKILTKKPWIAYPGSTIQQNYAEALEHGYLSWNIESKDRFDLKFVALQNPGPFITIEWLGSVESTVEHAAKICPLRSRIRIESQFPISHKDVVNLTSTLNSTLLAREITFKTNQLADKSELTLPGITSIAKDNVRNVSTIVALAKRYHNDILDEELWSKVNDVVTDYMSSINDGYARGTKWSLKNMEFSNTFAYGEDNYIDFSALRGIVGIFGQNRSGKSSIVGTILYTLFNATDRGSIKNLHVVNTRKDYCYSKATINVGSVDYVIERQTVKNESKRGVVSASTQLNVNRVRDNVIEDLDGEQRTDTEKVIRSLIGTVEDCTLTSLATQDDVKLFITYGSTKRRQILTRFLDLDIFDKMCDLAKNDLNEVKGELRLIPEQNWNVVIDELQSQVVETEAKINDILVQVADLQALREDIRHKMSTHTDMKMVTEEQVSSARSNIQIISSAYQKLLKEEKATSDELANLTSQLETLKQSLMSPSDVETLRLNVGKLSKLEELLKDLTHVLDRQNKDVKQDKKSLALLDEVPCGDAYPTCKFISNAHLAKKSLIAHEIDLAKTLTSIQELNEQIKALVELDAKNRLMAHDNLERSISKLNATMLEKNLLLHKQQVSLQDAEKKQKLALERLQELESALKNDENAELVRLRNHANEIDVRLKSLDIEKMRLATSIGVLRASIEDRVAKRERREQILAKTKVFETIVQAFSKKAIPNIIVKSMLPAINVEISKILQGIVDFTVELEADDESDSMEIYINYGDSKRIVELGSGMEKVISSIAIRVALTNISTLPKSDMLIIDESFGALDESGVEACNRLLFALKQYFKMIIVITHVEGIKDAADIILDVSKNGKNASIQYR